MKLKEQFSWYNFWSKNFPMSHITQTQIKFLVNESFKTFSSSYLSSSTPFSDDSVVMFFRSDHSWHSFEYDIRDIERMFPLILIFFVYFFLKLNEGFLLHYITSWRLFTSPTFTFFCFLIVSIHH